MRRAAPAKLLAEIAVAILCLLYLLLRKQEALAAHATGEPSPEVAVATFVLKLLLELFEKAVT